MARIYRGTQARKRRVLWGGFFIVVTYTTDWFGIFGVVKTLS